MNIHVRILVIFACYAVSGYTLYEINAPWWAWVILIVADNLSNRAGSNMKSVYAEYQASKTNKEKT
jgi:hypothetical protein